MATIASSALKSATRLGSGSSAVVSAPLRGLSRAAARAAVASKRAYVTQSRSDNARVETAIKLDKKDFANIPPPQMDVPSNAKVSPMAGTSISPLSLPLHILPNDHTDNFFLLFFLP